MRYAALILGAFVIVVMLIAIFQNLFTLASDFGLLFFHSRVTPTVPLLIGFIGGVIATISGVIFFRDQGESEWTED